MTSQQILIVAVRVFAIAWFLESISHLLAALQYAESYDGNHWTTFTIILPFVELLACVLLWSFPATLSRRLLKGGDAPVDVSAPPLLEWQSMIVIAIGLWTLSYAIPDAVYLIIHLVTGHQQGLTLDNYAGERWAQLAATLVQNVIGLWLLTRARGLAALLFPLRTASLRS